MIDVAREHHADLLAEVVLDRVDAGRECDAREDAELFADVERRAAHRADALAAVVVVGRLMLADLVVARARGR